MLYSLDASRAWDDSFVARLLLHGAGLYCVRTPRERRSTRSIAGDRLNEYEMVYVISPRVANDDVPAVIDRVSALVTEGCGEILSVDNWGRRRLAYPIGQHFEGTYVLSTFRLPPAGTATLEAGLRLSEDVIRHLLIQGIIPPMNRGRGDDRERERAPVGAMAGDRGGYEGAPPASAADVAPGDAAVPDDLAVPSDADVAEAAEETAGLPDAITAAQAREEAADAPGAGGEVPAEAAAARAE